MLEKERTSLNKIDFFRHDESSNKSNMFKPLTWIGIVGVIFYFSIHFMTPKEIIVHNIEKPVTQQQKSTQPSVKSNHTTQDTSMLLQTISNEISQKKQDLELLNKYQQYLLNQQKTISSTELKDNRILLQKNEISINKLEKQIFNLNQQMIYPSSFDKKSQ